MVQESYTAINICNRLQHGSLKKWTMPFCAFFTAFTVVMTILVLSIDLGGRRLMYFNASNIYDFENSAQNSLRLVALIREKYLRPPLSDPRALGALNQTLEPPSPQLLKLFHKKRGGVFVECGANTGGVSGGTEWLERRQGWRGLITQAHPSDYARILSKPRPNSVTANVCISPTSNPKYAWFRNSSVEGDIGGGGNMTELTRVPCFPLYSLLLAYNVTTVDLLILNLLSAELQVMKTLPLGRVRIHVVSLVNSEDDTCCEEQVQQLLRSLGYTSTSPCPSTSKLCFYVSTP